MRNFYCLFLLLSFNFAFFHTLPNAQAQQQRQETDTQELAKKLANPVSSLISVPFQNTYNCCYGPDRATRYTLNIQPVIPFSINEDWNLIMRTIVPVVYQQAPLDTLQNRFGLSDVVQSFFLSPKQAENGIVWGAGPVFLWPSASSASLGTQKWGAGPTAVILKQQHGWTAGGLANHIWSYAGKSDRENISTTLLQPFISYTFPDTLGLSLSTESSYDWVHQQWTVPVDLGISKVFSFGKQHVSLGLTGQYYVKKPEDGPQWGARFTATFLFPK